MKKIASFIILFLLISSPVMAEQGTGLEVSDYKNIEVLIEPLGESAKKIGLTVEAIKNKVELRIRSAGLKIVPKRDDDIVFYVNINVTNQSYATSIRLVRHMKYYKNYTTFVSTWITGATATHGGDGNYIVEGLNSLMDDFLNGYLKANIK